MHSMVFKQGENKIRWVTLCTKTLSTDEYGKFAFFDRSRLYLGNDASSVGDRLPTLAQAWAV